MSFLIGEIAARITGDNSQFNRTISESFNTGSRFIGDIGSSMQAAGRSMTNFGASLTKAITIPLAAATVAIFKFGKDFEGSLSKVIGLVGISRKQTNEWGNEILKMAPNIGRAPTELADALFFVTSAGIRGAAAMDVLTKSGKAASAGLGETKTIADLVTSAMNAYGQKNLSAGKATDVLVSAVREGKAEASELAMSMGEVLPIAAEMGVEFEEVAAAQAAMTKTGTNASEAATHLKSILAGMIKPSKQANDQLKLMGTSAAEMRRKIREEGLLSALSDLKDMTNKYGEEAMAKVYPNIRALLGVLDLTGESLEDNVKVFANVKNSTGMLDSAFKAASETLQFRWDAALSQVKTTAIKFFDVLKGALVPVLEKLISVLGYVGDRLSGLPMLQKQLIAGFLAITAIAGPAFIMLGTIVGTVGAAISGIATIIGTLGAVIGTIGLPGIAAIAAGMAILAVEIVAVISIIAGIIGSFVKLYKTNEEFRNNVIKTWTEIKESAKMIFNEIKDTIVFLMNIIKSFWAIHGEEVLAIVKSAWEIMLGFIRFSLKILVNTIKIFTGIIEGDWSQVWESVKTIVITTLNGINTVIFNIMKKIVETTIIKFDEMKTGIKGKLEEINESMFTFFVEMQIIVSDGMLLVKDSTTTKFNEIKEVISEKLAEWGTIFLDGMILVRDTVINKFNEIKELVKEKLTEWGAAISEWFSSMPEMITQLLIGWKDAIIIWAEEQNQENIRQFGIWGQAIEEWFNSIPDRITECLSGWWESIGLWYETTKENIGIKLSEWWETISTWFMTRPEKIQESLTSWWESIGLWYEETKKNIETKLSGWWGTISTWFMTRPAKIESGLKNWWSSIRKSFNEAKETIKKKLDEWWTTIQSWFVNLANKPEVRRSGRQMINKIGEGNKDAKPEFIDKLGKIIVDVMIAALKIAAVTIIATGREIVKRMIKGIGEVSLKSAGQKIVSSLIAGIKSMYGSVTKVVRDIAEKIRDFFPFSPAKTGPLKTLDKLNFGGPIMKSLDKAKQMIEGDWLGNIVLNRTGSINTPISSANNQSGASINGTFNFYGVQDTFTFMKEMRSTIRRYGGNNNASV